MKRIEEMNLWERLYFPEVIRGLTITGYRFWRNLIVHTLQKLGLASRIRHLIIKRVIRARVSHVLVEG